MTATPVWINGSLEGRIEPLDRGLTLGDGIFDTAVAFRGVPFAGARHIERLMSQADAIGIELAGEAVRDGWAAILSIVAGEAIILRTTVTRGRTGRGLWPAEPFVPTIIVSGTSWSAHLFGQAVRLVTGTIRRNSSAPSSRLKTLGYLDNVLAAREAAERGADDALLLNTSGWVACTSIANVFALHGDRLSTPPVSDGVLPGIMRGLVLEAAEELGIRPAESSLKIGDLLAADAVFLTNSVRFLSPVMSLDDEPLSSIAGAAVARLADVIAAQVESECGIAPGPPPDNAASRNSDARTS